MKLLFFIKKHPVIYLAMLLLFMGSCKKTSNYSFIKDIKIEILLTDESGEDLFNPESYTFYNKDSIRIYYLINNEPVEIYNPRMEAPRNFYVNYSQGRFRLQLYPNYELSEELPVTILYWNSHDTDTLKCGFIRNSNTIVCTKIWYNEDFVWEQS